MRTARIVAAALVCASLLLAAWAAWVAAAGGFSYRPLQFPEPDGPRPLIGALHVHTRLSGDASGSVDQIAAAAARAGLDFVVIADHSRALGDAGRVDTAWHGGVLVVGGAEISTDSGHLMALGLRPHPFALGPTGAQAIADIEELGGDAYIAHPGGGETAWKGGWLRARGVEIASLSSALVRASRTDLLAAAMLVPVNPEAATARLAANAWGGVAAWDERTAMAAALARPLVGVGSTDAHGPLVAGFPDYETAFRALNTMVWLQSPRRDEDARAAAASVLRQMAAGRVATVYSALGRAPGLVFRASRSGSRSLDIGDTGPWRPDTWTFRADLGATGAYRLELLRDGQVVASSDGQALEFDADAPGTYRLQALRTDVGDDALRWIATGAIYLWTDEAIVAGRINPAPPLPLPPLQLNLLAESGWSAESDADSGSAMGRSDGGLRWDLRVAAAEREGAYTALSWRPRTPLDWQEMAGLGVRLRADRTLRVSLRLWTRDAAGGEQTWERVVRADTEGAASVAPFEAFRRIDRRETVSGVPLQALAGVTGIALVVTPQRLRPGTEAGIEVQELGAYGGGTTAR